LVCRSIDEMAEKNFVLLGILKVITAEAKQGMAEVEQAREETQQAREETQQVRLIVKSLTNKLKAIEDSSSWKLSAPFRYLKDQLKGKDHE
ncbi:hypothetical protein N9C85_00450, partial [Synechococcus sp. AH-224-I15]|nr:hypothetical protein [Synechococcus sp. AH-224-I15]